MGQATMKGMHARRDLVWALGLTLMLQASGYPVVAAASKKIATAVKAPSNPAKTHSAPSEAASALPPPTIAQAPSEEERDFARAQELLAAGKESEAFLSYADFLRRYPTSAWADDAQFSVGEIYFRQRKYEEAAAEYRKVFRFGVNRSDRIPDAAFQLGECWFRLKKSTEARIEWEALRRKFPNSDASARALASLGGVP